MATVPPKDEQPTRAQRVAALWTAPARLGGLAALVGALVTFSPQPAAAIGALLVVLVAFEVGRKLR